MTSRPARSSEGVPRHVRPIIVGAGIEAGIANGELRRTADETHRARQRRQVWWRQVGAEHRHSKPPSAAFAGTVQV